MLSVSTYPDYLLSPLHAAKHRSVEAVLPVEQVRIWVVFCVFTLTLCLRSEVGQACPCPGASSSRSLCIQKKYRGSELTSKTLVAISICLRFGRSVCKAAQEKLYESALESFTTPTGFLGLGLLRTRFAATCDFWKYTCLVANLMMFHSCSLGGAPTAGYFVWMIATSSSGSVHCPNTLRRITAQGQIEGDRKKGRDANA